MMDYRRLGRTELLVSEIGVGGHHLRKDAGGDKRVFRATAQERAEVFSRALDNGITFFDTTFREEVIAFGDALRLMGRRDEMVLCSMDEQYAFFRSDDPADYGRHTAEEIDNCLRWLGTDWIDVYWLRYDRGTHTDDMLQYSIEAMRSAKEMGKIREIGNSGHDASFMRKSMGEWDAWDVIMFPHNFCQHVAQDYVLPAAQERDVGVVVMKPFSCGRVFRTDPSASVRDPDIWSPEKQSRIARAALEWILKDKRVHTVIPAMNALHHVDDAVAASGLPVTAEEQSLLSQIAARSSSYEETFGGE